MLKALSRGNNGQSLIEILVALTLLILGIGFAIVLFFGSQSITLDQENAMEAEGLAKEGLETTRRMVQTNWTGVSDGTSSDQINLFTREITITSTLSNQRLIRSTVSWQATPQRQLSVELTTLVTNWRVVRDSGGDTGGGGLSGDWRNPRTLGSVDLGPGNSATDLDVKNKIIYLTTEASAAAKPDFFIIDATNGQAPFTVSQLNTGPSLNALDVAQQYAYVANRSTTEQLQIIDTGNQSNPTLLTSFRLPGVSGSGAIGQSIYYYQSKVFIGTKKATGPEFHIVDVSNPVSPVSLGSFEINADVNAILVTGSLAYIATSENDELRVLNVSNPSSISQVGNYFAPGNSEDGKALSLVGNRLYLGRTLGGNHDDHHELHILDVASSSPTNLGSKNFIASINDLVARDYLAFLATTDSNNEFQVWDISDPSNITFWSSFNFSQIATGIDYEDNTVYVSVRSNDALRIITASP